MTNKSIRTIVGAPVSNGVADVAAVADQRRCVDRRQRTARALLYSLFMQRRRGPRRDADRARPSYVDCHPPYALALVVLTMLLCCADAFFTLILLGRGGEEINPVMGLLIEADTQTFVAVKFAVTGVGLFLALIHKNFTFFRAVSGYHILYAAFGAYLVLVKYELVLLFLHHRSL